MKIRKDDQRQNTCSREEGESESAPYQQEEKEGARAKVEAVPRQRAPDLRVHVGRQPRSKFSSFTPSLTNF